MFAIPGEARVGAGLTAAVGDDFVPGVDIVVGVGGGDGLPIFFVEVDGVGAGGVSFEELPADVEVYFLARGCGGYEVIGGEGAGGHGGGD